MCNTVWRCSISDLHITIAMSKMYQGIVSAKASTKSDMRTVRAHVFLHSLQRTTSCMQRTLPCSTVRSSKHEHK